MDGKDVMSEISQVNNDFPNNFESVKAAKNAFLDLYVNNHPHRLDFFKYTGSVNYEFDGRLIEDALTASYTVTDIDLSLADHWTRVYQEELPVIEIKRPNAGEFSIMQQNSTFWRFVVEEGDELAQVKVGERVTTSYSRDDPADPWTEDSSTTTDIMMSYFPNFIYAGGDPTSGGRGADNEENSVSILGLIYSSAFIPNGVIYRLPWEDPWDNESDVFTDALADYIAAGNADDPGCWSGSTTMALEFS